MSNTEIVISFHLLIVCMAGALTSISSIYLWKAVRVLEMELSFLREDCRKRRKIMNETAFPTCPYCREESASLGSSPYDESYNLLCKVCMRVFFVRKHVTFTTEHILTRKEYKEWLEQQGIKDECLDRTPVK